MCHPGLNRCRLQFSSPIFCFLNVWTVFIVQEMCVFSKSTRGGEYWSVFHGRDLCHSLNSFVFVESVGGWLGLYSNWRAVCWRCLLVFSLFAGLVRPSIKVLLALPWLAIVRSAIKEVKTFPICQTEQNALQFSLLHDLCIIALTVYELWIIFCMSERKNAREPSAFMLCTCYVCRKRTYNAKNPKLSNMVQNHRATCTYKELVAYHLQKVSGKFGWKINGIVFSCRSSEEFPWATEHVKRWSRFSSLWTGLLFGERVNFFHPFPRQRACSQALFFGRKVLNGSSCYISWNPSLIPVSGCRGRFLDFSATISFLPIAQTVNRPVCPC